MNWRKLLPGIEKICNAPGFILVCIATASGPVGLLYLQREFDFKFQYFPFYAALLYFIGRFVFALQNRFTASTNEVLGYLLVASTALSLLGQATFGNAAVDQNNVNSWDFTFAFWVITVGYFFAGAACVQVKHNQSNLVSAIVLSTVVLPLLYATEGQLFLNYPKMRQALGIENFSHLTIAEGCVFLIFTSYAFASRKLRPIIVLIAMLCLFSMQGRSSTLFALTTFLVYGFLLEGKKFFLSMVVLAVVAIGAYMALPIEQFIFEANENSMERMLLSSEDGDGSLQGRVEGFRLSIGHLPKSALFGDPSFLAIHFGEMGTYIHNILSMWQFYGALPFMLMLATIVRSLIAMKNRIALGQLSVMEEAASLLLIYSVVSVAFSKSILFYTIWFSVGYWMLRYSAKEAPTRRRKRTKKKRKTRSKSIFKNMVAK